MRPYALRVCRWLAAGALAAACGAAAAAPFPSKPITLIVPFGAGGIGDLTSRLLAQRMSQNIGQKVIVENRPSAGMVLAATLALHAPADGYTILLAGNGTAVSESLFKSLPYNIIHDFMQVSTIASFSLVLIAKPGSSITSIKDLIADAKAHPGKLNIGTVSVGSTQNLSAQLFKSLARINVQIVPFKRTPALLAGLRADNINVAFEFLPPVLPQIKAGTVKALAIASAKRFPGLPDVPTTAEEGLPKFRVASWNSLSVRINTPHRIIEQLNADIVKALKSPDVEAKFEKMGASARPCSSAEARRLMISAIAKWKRVIESAHIPRR